MINREILYERNLTGSFMKIPACLSASFDEKIMLKRKLPGLLPVEKCYVNGMGQYWYNITGKQSVDTYCRMKEIGIDFIERMIISICSQIEILEWNLIDTNCLMLDPELVYITNQTQEIIFTLYPDTKGDLAQELQHLMEYLLTKIDHKDMDAVHAAYGIYEKTLDPSYSVIDIRDAIVEAKKASSRERVLRQQAQIEQREREIEFENAERNVKNEAGLNKIIGGLKQKLAEPSEKNQTSHSQRILRESNKVEKKPIKKESMFSKEKDGKLKDRKLKDRNQIYRNMTEDYLMGNTGRNIFGRKEKKSVKYYRRKPYQESLNVAETPSYEVSMHEELVQEMPEVHPTVCLADYQARPQGMLLYEGTDNRENIPLMQPLVKIGKGKGVDAKIEKGTISHFHAQINHEQDTFYIEDLNSTNGTFVNGEGLTYKERKKLAINDIVQFADIRYRFV